MKLRLLGLTLLASLGLSIMCSAAFASSTAADATPGLDRLDSVDASLQILRGIATFDAVPNASQTLALRSLGLTVQPMKRLPLALVKGTPNAFRAAVQAGVARDVYLDEPIQLLDKASADSIGAALPRAAGYTGKGVTVAVVDSGCDATHADLKDRVVHNVKLVSAEYVNIAPDSSNTIVVPMGDTPYQNSDLGSGHGTHVAGIIAADGHTSPDHIGVAPEANLVCLAVGEVLFTTAVVTAYDYLLDQPNLWNVKVINNSWGNSFQQFDPRAPVHVATKAMADLGVNVFFASGNSGFENAEASLNPFSSAPWVTSVASMDVEHVRASTSSNGLIYDNSLPATIGAGGYTTFTNHRIGVYHPDITAPGEGISSTCTPTGLAITCPDGPDSNATASGTSMASPHAAGAAAVLLQANPALTIGQLRSALQATAKPVTNGAGTSAFWQTGYGHIDLNAAVALVRKKSYAKDIPKLQATADTNVLSSGPKVIRSDFWTYDAPRATALGTDSRTFSAPVSTEAKKLKVTLSHPSSAVTGIAMGMLYTVTVTDAAGKVVGTTTEPLIQGAGTASVLIDLVAAGAKAGTYTFAVRGDAAASDPDTLDSESLLGRVVVLQVAQLR